VNRKIIKILHPKDKQKLKDKFWKITYLSSKKNIEKINYPQDFFFQSVPNG